MSTTLATLVGLGALDGVCAGARDTSGIIVHKSRALGPSVGVHVTLPALRELGTLDAIEAAYPTAPDDPLIAHYERRAHEET
jgi:hypothetical protein